MNGHGTTHPMIDSSGFLVAPDEANTNSAREIRSGNPASRTFARRSSTFNYLYESDSSADEWVDVSLSPTKSWARFMIVAATATESAPSLFPSL